MSNLIPLFPGKSPKRFRRSLFLIFFLWGLASLQAINVNWNNGSGGNWSDPANWDTGYVPDSTDDVFITILGTYTVTLDMDATIKSITIGASSGTQTLYSNNHTLTLTGTDTSIIYATGFVNLTSSNLNGSGTLINNSTIQSEWSGVNIILINNGLYDITKTNTMDGTFTNEASGILRMTGVSYHRAIITFANGFTNHGLIEYNISGNNPAVLNVTSGTLINASDGIIRTASSSYNETNELNAQLDNQGTVTVNSALVISKDEADHVNSGTVSVSGGNLTITQGGTDPSFSNTGIINIAGGKVFTISGGLFANASGGNLLGTGNLNVSGATFSNHGTISPGASPGTFSITGDANLDSTSLLFIELNGSTDGQYDRIQVSGSVAMAGTLRVALTNGFVPPTGIAFSVLQYTSGSGNINRFEGINLDSLALQPIYKSNELVLASLETSESVNLDSGLVAFYPFNGNANDESGNGRHGTVDGATPGDDRYGVPNSAYSFDGENDEINFDYLFPLHDTTDATIAFWLRVTPDQHRTLFWTRPDDYDGNRYNIFVNGNNTFGVDYRGPNGTLLELFGSGLSNTGIPVESDEWINMAIVRTGNTYFLFKNSVLVDCYVDVAPNLPDVVGWQIAGRSGFHYRGFLDDIYLYNRALNRNEVTQLWQMNIPSIQVTPTTLTASLEPDQTTSQTIAVNNVGTGDLMYHVSGGDDSTGYALNFDGSDDCVVVPDTSLLHITNALTLAAWVKPESYQDYDRIIAKNWSTNDDPWAIYRLSLANENTGLEKVEFAITIGGVDYILYSSDGVPLQSWTHVAGTYDGNALRIYINGHLSGTLSVTGAMDTNTQPLYIGKNQVNDINNFHGLIDEVQIWDTALPGTTIREWMNRIITDDHPQYTHLKGYWRFNDGNGTIAQDYSGNGNHGLLTNGPVWIVSDTPLIPDWLSISPAFGQLAPDSSGTVTFTFNSVGLDSGQYNTSLVLANNDPDNGSIPLFATLQVFISNRAPVAVNDTLSINEDANITITVLANDSDFNGQSLTIAGVTDPSHGTVAINTGDTTLTYTPVADYHGPDGFSYIVSDGSLTDTAQVMITVRSLNDPPELVQHLPDTTINEDTFAAVVIARLEDYFTDRDTGDQLTFTGTILDPGLDSLIIGSSGSRSGQIPEQRMTRLRLHGDFRIHPAEPFAQNISREDRSDTTALTVYPSINFNGTVRVVIMAQDDSSAVARDTMVVTIQPVNDPPVLVQHLPDTTIIEDTFAAVLVSRLEDYFTDWDVNDQLTFTGTALDPGLDSLKIGSSGTRSGWASGQTRKNRRFDRDFRIHINNMVTPCNQRDERSDTTAITIYPSSNFHGDVRIVITAEDNSAAVARDTMVVTVQPVNDPPEPFTLLTPTDGDTLDTLTVVFRWAKANDVDQDSVYYRFHLYGAGSDTFFTGLMDTSLSFDGTNFFIYDTIYSWVVEATDRRDTVAALAVYQFRTPVLLAVDQASILPERYSLEQNYPNPFNPKTTIQYALPRASMTNLVIFDLKGRMVRHLVAENETAGIKRVTWDGKNDNGQPVSSGVYLYILSVEDVESGTCFLARRKLILLK